MRSKHKKLTPSTVEYLIQPDKKDLMELINYFQQEVDDVNVIQELGGLIEELDVYLITS